MCKGIKYLSSLFSDPLSSPLQPQQHHLPRQRRVWREEQVLSSFLRIVFQVHYCSNSYNLFLKNISLKLKSSITFNRKALRPCKGHFWTDKYWQIFLKYIGIAISVETREHIYLPSLKSKYKLPIKRLQHKTPDGI